jgi:hypothetical protein
MAAILAAQALDNLTKHLNKHYIIIILIMDIILALMLLIRYGARMGEV